MVNPKTGMRELAYVVRVDAINPLPGYDRVERATVGGWNIVVKKDQFKPGDLGIYFEIDSQVPAKEPFMFLEPKKFKIKTQKMCKTISQGLLMHPSDFGWTVSNDIINTGNQELKVGDFVTSILGVIYASAEDNARKNAASDNKQKYQSMATRKKKLFKKMPFSWLMKR